MTILEIEGFNKKSICPPSSRPGHKPPLLLNQYSISIASLYARNQPSHSPRAPKSCRRRTPCIVRKFSTAWLTLRTPSFINLFLFQRDLSQSSSKEEFISTPNVHQRPSMTNNVLPVTEVRFCHTPYNYPFQNLYTISHSLTHSDASTPRTSDPLPLSFSSA